MINEKDEYKAMIYDLEYLLERVSNPTRNDLEVGFRHSPLRPSEIMERQKVCLEEATHILGLHLPKMRAMYEEWCIYDDLRNS